MTQLLASKIPRVECERSLTPSMLALPNCKVNGLKNSGMVAPESGGILRGKKNSGGMT